MAKAKRPYSDAQIERFCREHGYHINRLIALGSEFGAHLNEGGSANCDAVMRSMAEVCLEIQDKGGSRGRTEQSGEPAVATATNVTALRSNH